MGHRCFPTCSATIILVVLCVVVAFADIQSTNNILCSNFDEMSIYTGSWSFTKTSNDTCELQQTGTGDHQIWFGTADGNTYDTDYYSNEFVLEASVKVVSGTHNAGILFRTVSLSGDQFYYFGIGPNGNYVAVWICCWSDKLVVSQTLYYDVVYDLKIVANGNVYNFSVNNVVVGENIELTDYITGGIGLISYSSVSTFYSLNFTRLPLTNSPTSDPSSITTGIPSGVPTDIPTSIPTSMPSEIPSTIPSSMPSDTPSSKPTNTPSDLPSQITTTMLTEAPTSMTISTTKTGSGSSGSSGSTGSSNSDSNTLSEAVVIVLIASVCIFLICVFVGLIFYKTMKHRTEMSYRKEIELKKIYQEQSTHSRTHSFQSQNSVQSRSALSGTGFQTSHFMSSTGIAATASNAHVQKVGEFAPEEKDAGFFANLVSDLDQDINSDNLPPQPKVNVAIGLTRSKHDDDELYHEGDGVNGYGANVTGGGIPGIEIDGGDQVHKHVATNEVVNVDSDPVNESGHQQGVILKEEKYQEWTQEEVLIWLKMVLINNGIEKNMIKSFLIEFSQKCVSGPVLKQLKQNEKLIDAMMAQFSPKNQAFGIWLVIKSTILSLGKQ